MEAQLCRKGSSHVLTAAERLARTSDGLAVSWRALWLLALADEAASTARPEDRILGFRGSLLDCFLVAGLMMLGRYRR
jgi:hypothetical protein